MKKLLICFIISLLFLSCNHKYTYLDEIELKEEAINNMNLYYGLRYKNQYDSINSFFSKDFFKETSKDSLSKIYNTINKTLGKIKKAKLLKWNTKRETINGQSSSEYFIVYEVEYENFNAIETYNLIKIEERILIHRFSINSSGFNN